MRSKNSSLVRVDTLKASEEESFSDSDSSGSIWINPSSLSGLVAHMKHCELDPCSRVYASHEPTGSVWVNQLCANGACLPLRRVLLPDALPPLLAAPQDLAAPRGLNCH